MSTINDGGPAFPHLTHEELQGGVAAVTNPQYPGMSIRDEFAKEAMAAHISRNPASLTTDPEKVAALAYKQADAMLDARQAESAPAMSNDLFRALLDMLMCFDPAPDYVKEWQLNSIFVAITNEAVRRGYSDWIDAYHEFKLEAN